MRESERVDRVGRWQEICGTGVSQVSGLLGASASNLWLWRRSNARLCGFWGGQVADGDDDKEEAVGPTGAGRGRGGGGEIVRRERGEGER